MVKGSMLKKRLLIFGFGYTAEYLSQSLPASKFEVIATVRQENRLQSIADKVSRAELFNGSMSSPELGRIIRSCDYVLNSIPPSEGFDPVFRYHRDDFLHAKELKWFGYLSTTGVYGDWQGAWVDESFETKATEHRQKIRLDEEQQWLKLGRENNLPVHIFRLSGIYGPGRNQLEDLKDGTARRIYAKDQVFSRIHVEDIASVLRASMEKPNPCSIYNVADDLPAASHEVIEYAAELLGIDPPPKEELAKAKLSPMAKSFYAANRRVSNFKIKNELGVRLKYPNYQVGLKGLFADDF
jgi:nucleoside-diphosphate-sugar epimerase